MSKWRANASSAAHDPSRPRCHLRHLVRSARHVAIDSSGMLMSASGEPVAAAGTASSSTWTVKPQRLPDGPLRRDGHDHRLRARSRDRVDDSRQDPPQIGHVYGYRLEPADDGTLVTSYYDWSNIDPPGRMRTSSRSSPRCPPSHARILARTPPRHLLTEAGRPHAAHS